MRRARGTGQARATAFRLSGPSGATRRSCSTRRDFSSSSGSNAPLYAPATAKVPDARATSAATNSSSENALPIPSPETSEASTERVIEDAAANNGRVEPASTRLRRVAWKRTLRRSTDSNRPRRIAATTAATREVESAAGGRGRRAGREPYPAEGGRQQNTIGRESHAKRDQVPRDLQGFAIEGPNASRPGNGPSW